ncbi:neuronal PAS domain-containing protein 2-like [Daphnia carinata]|uniref:neuronal PAS domain-containing protein 2-like n=1 Tax=Daphnia carinata TaxID=120202 RepID=UPI00257B5280|nr:neuronal PAS domain-containing protein 2-like [Daphnia carinata]
MDKMSETLPSSSREMRNRAEKQRRDKLNAYISELYSLVPSAAAAPRKLDKTSTLRLSANFLRIHQNVDLRMKPYNRWNAIAGHTILEKLDSFLLVVSCCSGKIIYVTDRVEKLLGHAQVDMMGYQLSCFVHQADQDAIEKRLSAFATQVAANPDATDSADGQVYSFECRLAGRQLSRGEPTVYERVSVSGTFRGPRRRRDWADLKSSDRSVATVQQHNDYSEPLFIGLVRILQTANTLPPLTIMQAVQDEYVTQHTTTGTIMQTDHRIAIIAGYLTGEVTGMSAYDYVYKEDLEYTLKAQSLMLSRSEGMVTYRLRTSTGRLIFLRSRGFIQYDENTKEIISFFCINSLIDEEQGMKEMLEMRAMLDKLNIGTVTPAIASSPTSTIEPVGATSTQEPLSRCVRASVGKPPPSFSSNGCHLANGSRASGLPRPSIMPNGHNSLCISPSSELQYSPSGSSSSSFSEERCQSSTPHSLVSSPMEIPNLVAVSYPFAPVPFPWRPSTDCSPITTTSNGHVNAREVSKSPDVDQSDPLGEPGSLALALDHQWETAPNSQSMIVQHNGPQSHQQSLVAVSPLQAHLLQSSPNDNTEPIRPTLKSPPLSTSCAVRSPYQHQEDALKISIPDRCPTNELSRNNCLNGYIIWPQKMSPKNRKENLILSYLDVDKHAYKQPEIAGTDQHYFHGDLKVNAGTNSA